MNRNYYPVLKSILIGLIGVLSGIFILSSCRSNSNLERYGKTPTEREDKESYKRSEKSFLRLQIATMPAVSLRADKSDPFTRIESLSFLFFSGLEDDSQLLIHEHYTSPDLSKPIELRLVPGEYQLVVLANPTTKVLELCYEGNTWKNFNDKQHITTASWTTRSSLDPTTPISTMLFSNDQGAIAIHSNHFSSTPNEPSALPTPLIQLSATLGRVLPYGIPTLPATMVQVPTETIRPFFLVANKAKYSYLLRRLALLLDGTQEQPGDASSFVNRFAYTPDYDLIAAATPDQYATLAEEYRRPLEASSAIGDRPIYSPIVEQLEEANLYLRNYYHTETTTPAAQQTINAFLPKVLLAFPLYPKSLQEQQPDFDPKNGWAAYQHEIIDGKTLCNYLLALKKDPKTPKPNGISTSFFSAIKALVSDASIWNKDESLKGFNKNGIRFYEQCYNYFLIPLVHQPSAKDDAYGRYGLVRNCSYNLHIMSISHFGQPTIPSDQGNIGTYQTEKSASLTIELTPVGNINQDINL